jgi:hypothetical protein
VRKKKYVFNKTQEEDTHKREREARIKLSRVE